MDGIHFAEKKSSDDLSKTMKELLDLWKKSSKSNQEKLKPFLKDLAPEKERFRYFSEQQIKILKETDKSYKEATKALDLHNKTVEALRRDTDSYRKYLLDKDSRSQRMKESKQLNKEIGRDLRQQADRNFFQSARDAFLTKSGFGPLAQILTGNYVNLPGSQAQQRAKERAELKGVSEQKVRNKQESWIEDYLDPHTGAGKAYLGDIKHVRNVDFNWKRAQQRAYENFRNSQYKPKTPIITPISESPKLLPFYPEGKKKWELQPRDKFGKFIKENEGGLNQTAMRKGKDHPSRADVAKLPAAYSTGFLFLADQINGEDEKNKTSTTNKTGGGLLGGGTLTKVLGGGNISKFLSAGSAGAIAIGATAIIGGALLAINDGLKTAQQAKNWDVSKGAAFAGGALAGQGGIKGTLLNMAKFGLIGGGAGLIAGGPVGAAIGATAGVILGGSLSIFLGPEKAAKISQSTTDFITKEAPKRIKAGLAHWGEHAKAGAILGAVGGPVGSIIGAGAGIVVGGLVGLIGGEKAVNKMDAGLSSITDFFQKNVIDNVKDFFQNVLIKKVGDFFQGVGKGLGSAWSWTSNAATSAFDWVTGKSQTQAQTQNQGQPASQTKRHIGGVIPGIPGKETMVKALPGEVILSPSESTQFVNNLNRLINSQNTQPIIPNNFDTKKLEELISKNVQLQEQLVAEMKKNNELSKLGNDQVKTNLDRSPPMPLPSRAFITP